LELAIEQELVLYTDEEVFELIESAFKKVLRRRRGPDNKAGPSMRMQTRVPERVRKKWMHHL
jgi:hypothetical protein